MKVLAIACILVLAGCATAEERADALAVYIGENYGPACAKLGYEPGSEGHRNCMLSLHNTDQLRMSAPPAIHMYPPIGRIRRQARTRRAGSAAQRPPSTVRKRRKSLGCPMSTRARSSRHFSSHSSAGTAQVILRLPAPGGGRTRGDLGG